MSPKDWGPPIWTLFHTMAAQLNDEKLVNPMMDQIQNVCSYLPCPECSTHAKHFFRCSARPTNKKEAIDMLYTFHNIVNKRSKKKPYDAKELEVYNNKNLLYAFNQFVRVYHTKGNMHLLTESWIRPRIVSNLKKFICDNITKFGTPNEEIVNECVN